MTEKDILSELAALPEGAALARTAREVGRRASHGRVRDLPTAAADLLAAEGLVSGKLSTSAGDPVLALERGNPSRGERALLGAMLAKGVADAPPSGVDAEDRATAELLWLAAHTPMDAFPALDAAAGDRALGLWGALTDLVRRIDAGREPGFDRADALVGALSLRHASSPDVRRAAEKLADEVDDAAVKEALSGGPGGVAVPAGPPVVGEVEPAPRGPVATALLALSGVMLVVSGARLVAKLALGRKETAELTIGGDGVRIKTRAELLGRTVRESEHVLPPGSLARATRDVRFPRLALYGGLFALALGSWLGVSLFVDGARAASPSLLGQGLLLVAVGVAIELALTSLWPGARGKCRVVLVPKKGGALCIGGLDVDAAERALSALRAR